MSNEKKNEPVDIEVIRQRGIDSVKKHAKKGVAKVDEQIDRVMKALQNNKGHVAGMVFVLVPAEGTQLVDAENEEVWCIQDLTSTTPSSAAMLKMAIADFGETLDMAQFNRPRMPESLKSLLEHLEK
jgi:membrane-anchored protein YejM (alkaline phosphatase superfamily)